MKQSVLRIAVLMAISTDAQYSSGMEDTVPVVQVQDIRVGLAPDKTRLVFDLSGPVNYRLTRMEQPARLLIELPGSQTQFDSASISLRGTPINAIQTQTPSSGVLSYVINVEQGTAAQAFTLKPFEGRDHRLVLDLYTPNQASLAMNTVHSAETVAQPSPGSITQKTVTVQPVKTTSSDEPAQPQNSMGAWSGYVSLDGRLFSQSPKYPHQKNQDFSTAFKPEYYVSWANDEQQFGFSPFFRYDTADDQRTHADIRELYWQLDRDRLVVKAGIDVVFWGVTESQHLVDIINQTDLVENIDSEEKLGQPMVNLDYLSDLGNWEVYLLPYFRERTFPGKHGRLRSEPAVDTRNPEYESGSKQQHLDVAFRWSHNIGDWDIGLAQFSGTSREPYLQPDFSDGKLKLIPRYQQIDQTSLDAQATKGAWLWKLEAVYNDNDIENYYAYVGGFERTTFGIAHSPADLGILLEYHYDERGDEATSGLQSDVYLGLRLAANDIASTMALIGFTYDTDTHSVFGNIEASRRLTEDWSLGLELRFTSNPDEHENLYYIDSDDYLGVELKRYF